MSLVSFNTPRYTLIWDILRKADSSLPLRPFHMLYDLKRIRQAGHAHSCPLYHPCPKKLPYSNKCSPNVDTRTYFRVTVASDLPRRPSQSTPVTTRPALPATPSGPLPVPPYMYHIYILPRLSRYDSFHAKYLVVPVNRASSLIRGCRGCYAKTQAGTCIGSPVKMGDQIGGLVWCSSDIIFGLYCYCGLWPGQFEGVPYYPTMVPLEVVNHHHAVLQL